MISLINLARNYGESVRDPAAHRDPCHRTHSVAIFERLRVVPEQPEVRHRLRGRMSNVACQNEGFVRREARELRVGEQIFPEDVPRPLDMASGKIFRLTKVDQNVVYPDPFVVVFLHGDVVPMRGRGTEGMADGSQHLWFCALHGVRKKTFFTRL